LQAITDLEDIPKLSWMQQAHIKMAWEMLIWDHENALWQELGAADAEVRMMDPGVVTWRIHVAGEFLVLTDPAQKHQLEVYIHAAVQDWHQNFSGCQKLLIPLLRSEHWVLVVLHRSHKALDFMAEPDKVIIRYYDSLHEPSAPCQQWSIRIVAELLGMHPTKLAFPPRRNKWHQPEASAICEGAVVH
jgi:hypothetical protein